MRKRNQSSFKRIAFIVFGIIAFAYFFLFYGFGFIVNLAFSIKDMKPNEAKSTQKTQSDVTIDPSLQDVPYATNSATITVNGSGMPDTTMYLFRNNRKVDETKTDFEGNFSFGVTLGEGNNTLSVTSIEKDKRELSSRMYAVRYLNTPPKLQLTNVEDGKTYTSQNIEIEGSVPKEVFVTINDSPVVVRSDGTFAHTLRLKDGEQTLVIVATDVAGNQEKRELRVNYKKAD